MPIYWWVATWNGAWLRLTSVRGDRGENYKKFTAGSPKKKHTKKKNQETWWVLLTKKGEKMSRYCPFGSSQDLMCVDSIEKANHN
jgi:hypothetical protein